MTQTTLFKLATPSGAILCKPENIKTYSDKIAKKPAKWKAGSIKRGFPKSHLCGTTRIYVAHYLQMNNLEFAGGLDGYILSDATTTWPDPSLDTVETCEE